MASAAAASSALSNHLFNLSPSHYGGKQKDYLRRSEETISRGLTLLRDGVSEGRKPEELFFRILEEFSASRSRIAQDHNTKSAELFGRLRTVEHNPGGYFDVTDLNGPYDEYNRIVLGQLAPILREMNPDKKGGEKRVVTEEDVLGRKVRFDMEIWDDEYLGSLFESLETELRSAGLEKQEVDEIEKDYERLHQLKKDHQGLYQTLSKIAILKHLVNTYPSRNIITQEINTDNLRDHYAFGTMRVEINKKLYAVSRCITGFYKGTAEKDFIEKMMNCSRVMILHQDVFLIQETLREIAKIFADAVNWNSETESGDIQSLKRRVALFSFLYTCCMPYSRGSGAIGDWLELLLYRFHGFKASYNQDRTPTFEPLSSLSFSHFWDRYQDTMHLEPQLQPEPETQLPEMDSQPQPEVEAQPEVGDQSAGSYCVIA